MHRVSLLGAFPGRSPPGRHRIQPADQGTGVRGTKSIILGEAVILY